MMSHRTKLYMVFHPAMILNPTDEIAARLGAEYIHHQEHHPHAESGWHNEIFRA